MVGNEIYYVKLKDEAEAAYQDMTVKWPGLVVQSIEGLASRGTPKNIYTAEWVNSNTLDVDVPDEVFYEAGDIEITFYISDFQDHSVDPTVVHKNFIDYMTSKQVSIWSKYLNLANNFVFLYTYEPSSTKLMRPPGGNFIQGTLKLKAINSVPTVKTQ